MKTAWTKGLKPEQAKEMQDAFNASGRIRERLVQLLSEKVNAKHKEIRSVDMYSSPNWSLYQADAIGFERAINEVISLISQK